MQQKDKKYIYIVVAILILLAYFGFDGKSKQVVTPGQDVKQNVEQNVAVANPAAEYCVEQGGKSEIRNNPDGSQYGVCITKDKQECDEWEYFRGGCLRNI